MQIFRLQAVVAVAGADGRAFRVVRNNNMIIAVAGGDGNIAARHMDGVVAVARGNHGVIAQSKDQIVAVAQGKLVRAGADHNDVAVGVQHIACRFGIAAVAAVEPCHAEIGMIDAPEAVFTGGNGNAAAEIQSEAAAVFAVEDGVICRGGVFAFSGLCGADVHTDAGGAFTRQKRRFFGGLRSLIPRLRLFGLLRRLRQTGRGFLLFKTTAGLVGYADQILRCLRGQGCSFLLEPRGIFPQLLQNFFPDDVVPQHVGSRNRSHRPLLAFSARNI